MQDMAQMFRCTDNGRVLGDGKRHAFFQAICPEAAFREHGVIAFYVANPIIDGDVRWKCSVNYALSDFAGVETLPIRY